MLPSKDVVTDLAPSRSFPGSSWRPTATTRARTPGIAGRTTTPDACSPIWARLSPRSDPQSAGGAAAFQEPRGRCGARGLYPPIAEMLGETHPEGLHFLGSPVGAADRAVARQGPRQVIGQHRDRGLRIALNPVPEGLRQLSTSWPSTMNLSSSASGVTAAATFPRPCPTRL